MGKFQRNNVEWEKEGIKDYYILYDCAYSTLKYRKNLSMAVDIIGVVNLLYITFRVLKMLPILI